MSALADAQRDFASWLLAREAPARTPALRGDARASAAERLHVYRYAVLARLLGVLRDDFPALLAALGRERFDALAATYLRAHPSRHFSLRQLGARFPAFLATNLVEGAPWAADLARLELAVTDAFDAEDVRGLARADLARLPLEAWDALPLTLAPGVQRLALAWPVRELRAAHDEQRPLPTEALAARDESVLVWRQDERVLHRVCDATERALLACAARGATFGALCAEAARLTSEAEAPALAAQWLGRWLDEGLLRAEPAPA